jgi:hypothetical protein
MPEFSQTPFESIYDAQEFKNWINTNPKVKAWREQFKNQYGEDPDLVNSDYDYVGAWKAGIEPQQYKYDTLPNGEQVYHWGSTGIDGKDLKSENHPTRWKADYMKATGINPDSSGVSKDSAMVYLNKARK